MLSDAYIPLEATPPIVARRDGGFLWSAAVWTPLSLRNIARQLAGAQQALAEIPLERLLEAWSDTVEELRDPASAARTLLNGPLAERCRLSPEGLEAGLETVLAGVRHEPAAKIFAEARGTAAEPGLVVVFLASIPPGLAVQPLLPALALRRPMLLKSASAEPFFAPVFLEALCRREPRLRPAYAAVTWAGGEHILELPMLKTVAKVLAYGGSETMRDLEARAGAKLLSFGPKISIAAIGATVDPQAVAGGLAADVALFDQRGCLSVQAIYTAGDPLALAHALAVALTETARRWPAGVVDPHLAAAVQQVRDEARMRGLFQPELALREGTVLVEMEAKLEPSPGLRTVRIYSLDQLAKLPPLLAAWGGRLQGAALAGDDAQTLEPALRQLGMSRFAAPGELQSADATWHNGGISPLVALGGQKSP